jgi:hypothetical protein
MRADCQSSTSCVLTDVTSNLPINGLDDFRTTVES